MNKNKKKNHGQNPKRIAIAVLILMAVVFMLIGPRAKAESPELATAGYLVQHNIPVITLLKSMIGY